LESSGCHVSWFTRLIAIHSCASAIWNESKLFSCLSCICSPTVTCDVTSEPKLLTCFTWVHAISQLLSQQSWLFSNKSKL
jgi:hypothetical protein